MLMFFYLLSVVTVCRADVEHNGEDGCVTYKCIVYLCSLNLELSLRYYLNKYLANISNPKQNGEQDVCLTLVLTILAS